MKTVLIAVLSLLLACDQVFARVRRHTEPISQDDDNVLNDQTDGLSVLSKPEIIRAPVGGLARLPCEFNVNPDEDGFFAVVWLKNNVTLSVDEGVQDLPDSADISSRVSFDEKVTGPIIIQDLRPEDSANYTCRVSHTASVTHVLDVLQKPHNVTISPGGAHVVVKKGENVRLTCSASGNPAPEFKWFDRAEKLVKAGAVLDLGRAEHENVGKYTCHAINSEGKDVRHVTVSLKHKPEVKARKSYVSASIGDNAELICDVHHSRGEAAHVKWFRNGVEISDPSLQTVHDEKNHNSKASLKLAQIRSEDLAEYKCRAENDIGSAEATIHVVDVPTPALMVKQPVINKNNVTLTWAVESSTPLEEIEVRYKKDQTEKWTNSKVSVQSAINQDNLWIIKHHLTGLEGKHHAVLLTRNARGWSTVSSNIDFNSNNSSGESVEPATGANGGSTTHLSQLLSTCALVLLWRVRG